jgi:FKBP-type peptidyl-prolyl cis-trans isomerase (trigger factor)
MTIDFAIDGVYKAAITKEKILPVAQAEITEIISESPLKFVIHIEVFPVIEIDPKYKDIKLTKQKISVEEDEITNALKEIETKFTKFEHIQDKEIKAAI